MYFCRLRSCNPDFKDVAEQRVQALALLDPVQEAQRVTHSRRRQVHRQQRFIGRALVAHVAAAQHRRSGRLFHRRRIDEAAVVDERLNRNRQSGRVWHAPGPQAFQRLDGFQLAALDGCALRRWPHLLYPAEGAEVRRGTALRLLCADPIQEGVGNGGGPDVQTMAAGVERLRQQSIQLGGRQRREPAQARTQARKLRVRRRWRWDEGPK